MHLIFIDNLHYCRSRFMFFVFDVRVHSRVIDVQVVTLRYVETNNTLSICYNFCTCRYGWPYKFSTECFSDKVMTSLFILLIYASGYWDLECLLVVFREYFTEPRSPSPFLILRVLHHFGCQLVFFEQFAD